MPAGNSPAGPRCFDRHEDRLVSGAASLGGKLEQLALALREVGDAPLGDQPSGVIDDGDVVMVLYQSMSQNIPNGASSPW
jgi:hypothetical protein